MADELTVLLVSAGEPDENLVGQLEKQGIFAEQCLQNELSNMLALVEPALVVQLGSPGAAESTELLKATGNVRRVRLVVVADRKDLPELRKLDRAVVVSLLATDIAPAVVATRVSMLARKGPEKTVPPLRVAELPPALASAQPPRAVSKKPLTPLPLAVKPLETSTNSDIPASESKTPKKVLPRPTLPLTATAPLTATVPATPEQTSATPTAESGDSTPTPQVRPAPLLKTPALQHDEQGLHPIGVAPIEMAVRLQDARPRLALADSDITRADLIACALREAGISARLVPLDAAATRWQLVRSFRPNILLADSNALKGAGQIWYQLFQADKELRRAKVVSIPFERLFNEQAGTVNLRTLIPQIPQLSGVSQPLSAEAPLDEDDELDDERPTLIHEHSSGSNPSDDDDDRPTIASDPMPQFEDETKAFDMSNLASEVDAEFAAKKKEVPFNEEAPAFPGASLLVESATLTLDGLPPPVGRAAPMSVAQLPEPNSEVTIGASTISEIPEKKSSPRWVFAAFLLLAAAGGAFFAWKKGIFETKGSTIVAATTSVPKPPAPKPEAPEPEVAEEKVELTEQQRLWFLPDQKAVPNCPELVPELEELKKGGIQQATLSWDRARKTMVLGDLDKAQILMCEAVLIHPESLALEGLAGLYVSKRAPEQAMEWTKKALAVRPERRKTQELEGDVLSLLGKPDEARALWVTALGIVANQKNMDLIAVQYVADAEFQLKGGAVSQAELLYRRAATFSPENVDAAVGLASAFLAAGNPIAAAAWADRALALKPGLSRALVVQADLLHEAGDTQQALAKYQEVLKTDPGNARAHQQIFKLEQ